MKWEILCLTLPERKEFLHRLVNCLAPQLARNDDVTFTTKLFDPLHSLGRNREMMRQSAKGKYICFVDDDDLVSDDYIETIYPLLDRDYVGFCLQYYVDGAAQKLTHHSLVYDGWSEDEQGYYRDISHLNPMRRELALAASMEGGVGEDSRWAERIREIGKVRRERFVPRVMYHYYFRTRK